MIVLKSVTNNMFPYIAVYIFHIYRLNLQTPAETCMYCMCVLAPVRFAFSDSQKPVSPRDTKATVLLRTFFSMSIISLADLNGSSSHLVDSQGGDQGGVF